MSKVESDQKIYTIESYGGNGGLVTGSCHRLDIEKNSFWIDAGMFQGRNDEENEKGEKRNLIPIDESIKNVTDVLITHTHIDHIGRLPVIFKESFTPNVLATEETAAFMRPMLLNSAEVQAAGRPKDKLYDNFDVDKTLKYITKVEPFRQKPIGLKNSNITAEFLPNGHVMGSASILLRDNNQGKNILFTGDIGKPNQSLCGGYNEYADKYPNDPINVLMVESTSFDKKPVSFEEKKEKLITTINEVWKGGGNPVLPALSFHRTPELMEMIHNCQKNGEIPADCKIIIDAPFAMELLETLKLLGPDHLSRIYGNDQTFYKTAESSMRRFNLRNSIIVNSSKQSLMMDQEMAKYSGKAIIIASGGMGGFGRSVNYLHGNFGKNPKNAVLFNCYQVEGTEGHKLVKQGRVLKTGARVVKLEGFTSHTSGPEEVFGFLERFNLNQLETVIINHGSDFCRELTADEFRQRGYQAEIVLPKINQVVRI